MDIVRVMVPFHPSEFGDSGREVAEAAASAIRTRLPDEPVGVVVPQGAADQDYLQMARTLFVDVPWRDVGLVVMGTLLDGLREWLTLRVRQRKEAAEADPERIAKMPSYYFDEHATREEKEVRVRSTPYQVKIYGPRAELLAVVEQDEVMPEAIIRKTQERN